jgi:hypothetical protein
MDTIRSRRRLVCALGVVALLFALDGSAWARREPRGRGPRRSCSVRTDCAADEICRANGKCYKDVGRFCGSDLDCEPGETCRPNGVCHKDSKDACATDAECKTDEVCRDGKCHKDTGPGGCATDADCAAGEVCRDGECRADDEPQVCETDGDCEGGDVCSGGRCREVPPPPPPPPPPGAAEICGDCIDNDGNGLADFEDAACCGAGQRQTMTLQRGRLVPHAEGTMVQLSATLARRGFEGVDPRTHDVFLQIRPEGGTDVLCARVRAGRFAQRGRKYGYKGGKTPLASAKGVARMTVTMRRNGTVTFDASGTHAEVGRIRAGRLEVTVGFRSPPGDGRNRCSAATSMFKLSRRGVSAR